MKKRGGIAPASFFSASHLRLSVWDFHNKMYHFFNIKIAFLEKFLAFISTFSLRHKKCYTKINKLVLTYKKLYAKIFLD